MHSLDLGRSVLKAAVFYRQGPPDVFQYEDVEAPICGPNEILIRVCAISIEGGDIFNRNEGPMARPMQSVPHVIGYAASGEIVEVGSEVSHLRTGQRITTVGMSGSHAEFRAVPAHCAWLIPDTLDFEKASAIPTAFATAHECLFNYGSLRDGETVLVTGAAGGVGLAAIQLAKRAGARVIGAASGDDRLARLKAYGMDAGVNYRSANMSSGVMALTDGRGVDLVVEGVGGSILQESLHCLAHRGRISFVGAAAREPLLIDIFPLLLGSQSINGVYTPADLGSGRFYDLVQSLIERVACDELEVVIDRTYPLREAAAAHAYIEGRQAFGRVLLIP